MTGKVRVALLFGGRSSEHSVSCATAAGVLAALDPKRYEVIPIGITRDGAFVLEDADPERYALNPESLPEVADNGTRVRWPESTDNHELMVTDADGSTRSLGDVDVVFPILHGMYGEDGTVQGMLELVGLPYVGSGVLASALGMDKHFAKTVMAAAGLAVTPWRLITADTWATSPDHAYAALEELGLPMFVKPARGGSSFGVSKVSGRSELAAAIELALSEDDKAILEAAAIGREIECAVLGGRNGGSAHASVAGEIVFTGRDYYDFDAKYLAAPGIELVCPAQLSGQQLAQIQELAVRAFNAIGAAGLARVDFFLTDSGFIVNEINTMPGFTPISMFPKCWQSSGLSYPRLVDELISLALEPAVP